MKKVSTLEDKGGKPSEKVSNARHSSKAEPLQPRKAENAYAYTKGGKKPKEEQARHLETQSRKAEELKNANKQASRSHEEEFHAEDFSRYGTNFITERATKKGM